MICISRWTMQRTDDSSQVHHITRPSLCTAVVRDRRRPSLCCRALWLDWIKGILLLLLLLLSRERHYRGPAVWECRLYCIRHASSNPNLNPLNCTPFGKPAEANSATAKSLIPFISWRRWTIMLGSGWCTATTFHRAHHRRMETFQQYGL